MKDNLRQLSDAKLDILDADLLLFRGKGLISRTIRSYGRGRYSHVAKASWIKGELFCAEIRELKGGRIVTLESQVKKFPGQIDVFRVNAIRLPEVQPLDPTQPWYNREQADKLMLAFAGVEYGYWAIVETWLLHMPIIRLIAQANVDDEFVSNRPPYCSAATSATDRVGGRVDPVPLLSDKDTEPSDLSRSQFNRYMCTLIPDEPKKVDAKMDAPAETNAASEQMLVALTESRSVTEISADGQLSQREMTA